MFRQKNLKYFQTQIHWWTDCFRQNQLSWSEQPPPRCSRNTQEPTQSCFFASLYSSRCSSWRIAICGLYLCVWAKRDALLRVRGAPSVTRRSVSTKQDHWNHFSDRFCCKEAANCKWRTQHMLTLLLWPPIIWECRRQQFTLGPNATTVLRKRGSLFTELLDIRCQGCSVFLRLSCAIIRDHEQQRIAVKSDGLQWQE